MTRNLAVLLFLSLGWAVSSNAGVYTHTFQFDPSQGIFWNYPWHQCVSNLPEGEHIDSVQVQLRAKVFASGFYPPAVLISDTNVFNVNDASQRVGYFALKSSFYNNNYTLTATQMERLSNDKCAYFEGLSNGGTYYLDYCKLTVTTSILPCNGVLMTTALSTLRTSWPLQITLGEGTAVATVSAISPMTEMWTEWISPLSFWSLGASTVHSEKSFLTLGS